MIEIGAQCSELGHMLNPADQVVIGRIVFVDHGSPSGTPVIHQQIHVVPRHRGLAIGSLGPDRYGSLTGLPLLFGQLTGALNDVVLHCV